MERATCKRNSSLGRDRQRAVSLRSLARPSRCRYLLGVHRLERPADQPVTGELPIHQRRGDRDPHRAGSRGSCPERLDTVRRLLHAHLAPSDATTRISMGASRRGIIGPDTSSSADASKMENTPTPRREICPSSGGATFIIACLAMRHHTWFPAVTDQGDAGYPPGARSGRKRRTTTKWDPGSSLWVPIGQRREEQIPDE